MKTIYMETTIAYMGFNVQQENDPKKMKAFETFLQSGEVKQLDNGIKYLVIEEKD